MGVRRKMRKIWAKIEKNEFCRENNTSPPMAWK